MSPFIKKIHLLERIDALIRRRGTGGPKDLASRLDVSVRYIHKLLDYLRDMGAEIEFNHSHNSYEYLNPHEFQFSIGLSGANQLKVKGGRSIFRFFSRVHSLCREDLYNCNDDNEKHFVNS
ncbi:MAG: hypothetical protein R2824_11170 [Saprospiraceae bacterium]|nr:hypothetical protein [Lewinella sp.]